MRDDHVRLFQRDDGKEQTNTRGYGALEVLQDGVDHELADAQYRMKEALISDSFVAMFGAHDWHLHNRVRRAGGRANPADSRICRAVPCSMSPA